MKFKTYSILGMFVALISVSIPSWAEEGDSLFIDKTQRLGTKYTVTLKPVKLVSDTKEFKVTTSRLYNERYMGVQMIVRPRAILATNFKDTIMVAERMDDGMSAHEYTIVRSSMTVQIYRDKVLLGKIQERLIPHGKGITLYNLSTINQDYNVLIDTLNATVPDEIMNEKNISNMLPSSCKNLIEDPYCNRGFTCTGLNAEDRTFYSQNAIYTGWGPNAHIDLNEKYSGRSSIRLQGQAVYPNKGASLDVAINFAAATPYYIRAMVKSNGYEGKIGISNCNNYIHLTDTKGEWKQIEGVLTPTSASNLLYINNEDFNNNGTLWIDNVEVYEALKSPSSIGLRTEIPYVMLDANYTWNPTKEINVYMLGFTDNGATYSQINPEKVHMLRGSRLKKKIKGSQLYAVYFPGELQGMCVTGYYDGFNHTEEALLPGVDYILQEYVYPRFNYVDTDQPIKAGGYLVQFVDNMDGCNITMTFNEHQLQGETELPYFMSGNTSGANFAPANRFYRFNETTQCFHLTSGEAVKPFEAYIATDATVPVQKIVPNGISTGIKRLYANNGARISVCPTENGIIIYASEESFIDIYTTNGRMYKKIMLKKGQNTTTLPKGIYLVGQQKVIVK